MSEPKKIGDILVAIAADPSEDFAKVLRQCPFIQKELLRRKIISLDDLSDDQIKRLSDDAFLEDWIDGQVVMQKLHISPRTLQTLRSNGTIPYTKIGHKIWYLRQDIERVLRTNYIMFNIRDRYGEQ
jgi:hypothetical protein